MSHVAVVDADVLARESPVASRHDVAEEIRTGFPYRREHADAVARALAAALTPAMPKKGLITDLDDTLWRGLLGEVGIDGVQWSLEHGAHLHAVYQQMLANMAERGVLIAIASKNDPALVADALRRDDLVLTPERVFPVRASWGPKSEAVRNTWKRGTSARTASCSWTTACSNSPRYKRRIPRSSV